MKKRPIIALALGGGGALGYAHVGVLEALLENDISIDIIVGTSMGAVVGASFASGFGTQAMEDFAKDVSTVKMLDLNLNPKGLLSGRKVIKLLEQVIANKNIEDLPIKFACNAVNLKNGEEVILSKGNIIKAVRASMSVPGIFVPVELDGMNLIDGGVVNNIPHDIARSMGADIVIAVDVATKTTFESIPKTMVGCLSQAWLISQKELQKHRKKYYNILLQPNLVGYKQTDYNGKKALEMIKSGKDEANKKMKQIKAIIADF